MKFKQLVHKLTPSGLGDNGKWVEGGTLYIPDDMLKKAVLFDKKLYKGEKSCPIGIEKEYFDAIGIAIHGNTWYIKGTVEGFYKQIH